MRQTNWKDIAELIGIAAIVASLVFVGMQMKQSQQLAFAESAQMMRANAIEQGSLEAQHVDVWLRGNSGEELNREERAIYEILFTQKQNQWFFNWLALDSIGTEFEGVGPQSLARFLHQNPGAYAEWKRRLDEADLVRVRGDGTFPDFAAKVEADLKQLIASSDQK